MFLNIQPIIVPYISAQDIYQYAEAFGLTIGTTGSYYFLSFANDGFNNYPTGFATNVSGSGFWQGSGYTNLYQNYLYDNFASYLSGFTTGALSSGNQVTGYTIIYPIQYSGVFTSNLDYIYDNFASYTTGLLIQSNLYSGNTINSYSVLFPNLYSGTFNFLTAVKTGNGAPGSPLPFWTVTDTENSNYLWSGQGLDLNYASLRFPPIQYNYTNTLTGAPVLGPYLGQAGGGYEGTVQGGVYYPWSGGGPVLGNCAVIDFKYNVGGQGAVGPTPGYSSISSGFIELTGINTGIITGDFTLNIIWNWIQSLTPQSWNSWNYKGLDQAFYGPNPLTYSVYTGHNIGVISSSPPNTGGGYINVDTNVYVLAGGPAPNNVNYGPDYRGTGWNFAYGYNYQSRNPVNQDYPLIDYDIISGFGIYVYSSIWSGATWLMTPSYQETYSVPTLGPIGGANYPGNITYTGMNSGLISNIYAYVLGHKISGNLVTPNLPTTNILATGAIAMTGAVVGNYDYIQHTGSLNSYFGVTPGYVANGPMAQFTGFGFGIAQFITLTRSGTLVSLYQSGLLFATGYASGAINTNLPFLIGQSNYPSGFNVTGSGATGIYAPGNLPSSVYLTKSSGMGMWHLELWNYAQSQQTISSNLLTYQAPPKTGLILSTNFVLK